MLLQHFSAYNGNELVVDMQMIGQFNRQQNFLIKSATKWEGKKNESLYNFFGPKEFMAQTWCSTGHSNRKDNEFFSIIFSLFYFLWYKKRGGEEGLRRDYSSKRKKNTPTTRVLIYSLATLSSSSHVVNLSLGLFLRLPSLVSVESIFSQALNCTNLTFRLSNKWSRPSLPGLGKLAFDANRLRSSNILTTYHINRPD